MGEGVAVVVIRSDWLSIGDAAHRAGVSISWVRQLLERGDMVGAKTRLGYLVDPDSVDAWMAAREARNA